MNIHSFLPFPTQCHHWWFGAIWWKHLLLSLSQKLDRAGSHYLRWRDPGIGNAQVLCIQYMRECRFSVACVLYKMEITLHLTLESINFFIVFTSALWLLMIKHYFNVKISISHYQNEDESHALVSHAINQGRQSLKVFVQDKVKLTLHVVNVCILHILQKMPIEA